MQTELKKLMLSKNSKNLRFPCFDFTSNPAQEGLNRNIKLEMFFLVPRKFTLDFPAYLL